VRRHLGLFLFFLFAVVTDQLSKLSVVSFFNLYESRDIVGDYLKLTYIRNSGAAFGLSFGNSDVMFVITILVIILLTYLFFKGTLRPDHGIGRIAVFIVLGGAVVNLIDRIRFGQVIDFIDMGIGRYRWPVYNFADIYVTIGMFILFFTYAFKKDRTEDSITRATE